MTDPAPPDPADPAPDPEEPGNPSRARKRTQALGQSIGGVLFGFEQQVWRNVPPPHELVHHARPDDPVPAGDGGFMTLEMPAPLAPAGPAAGGEGGPGPAPGGLEPAGPDTVLASGDEHGPRHHRPPTPPRGLPDGPAPAPGVRGER